MEFLKNISIDSFKVLLGGWASLGVATVSPEKIIFIVNGVAMLGVAIYMKVQEDKRKAEKEKQRLEMEKEAHDQKLRQDEELHKLELKIRANEAKSIDELNKDFSKNDTIKDSENN